MNDGKGNFIRKDLPDALQLAPIFSFAQGSENISNNYLAAGNFYGVTPYEGRYDALFPTDFSFDKKNAAFEQSSILPEIHGEVRDIKWLRTSGGNKILVIARNNDSLLFYKMNK